MSGTIATGEGAFRPGRDFTPPSSPGLGPIDPDLLAADSDEVTESSVCVCTYSFPLTMLSIF